MARSTGVPRKAQHENSIELSPSRLQQPAPATTEQPRSAGRTNGGAIHAESAGEELRVRKPTAPQPTSTDSAQKDTTTVPQAVRDRFMNIREKYFFPNGDPAFQDLGTRLTTKSENAEIVRSLVEIAQARGWDEITVGGSKEFKRAVWHEATLQKMAVRGYAPTEADEARVVHAMARRAERSRDTEYAEAPEPGPPGRPPEPQSRPTGDAASPRSNNARSRDNVFRGELIEHGAENYKFDPHEDMSYFIKLRTERGHVIELWGKDFERALKESSSSPKVGDRVEIFYSGNKEVTVPKKERDAQGNVIREYDLRTHRNAWSIESAAFFQERAKLADIVRDPRLDPREVVKQNPQLAGTLAEVRAAELAAGHRFPDDAASQKRLVEAIRIGLADQIRRGEPLRAPLLRDRPRVQERAAAHSPPTI